MKQTAVEWLLFELSKNGLLPDGIPSDIHNKAKEMEEQHQQETFEQSRLAKIFEKDMPPVWGSWEQYYNEAFKSE
jgi:hypothetical protein